MKLVGMVTISMISFACLHAEVVRFELSNGDIVSAKVLSENDNVWRVEHATLGTLALKKSEAKRAIAKSKAQKGDSDRVSKKKPTNVPKSYLDSVKKRVSFGLNGRVAARHSQNWHTGLELKRTDKLTRWDADLDWFYGVTDGKKTDNEGQLIVNHDWHLDAKKNRFIFARTEYEYDELTTWEMRNSLFGGLGYRFTSPEKGSLQLRGGAGGSYQHGSVQEWSPEAIFASGSSSWKLSEYQSLKGELAYYPSFEDLSQYRTNLKLEWFTKVPDVDGLSLKFGIRNVFNSMGSSRNSDNDFKYFAGIVYDL